MIRYLAIAIAAAIFAPLFKIMAIRDFNKDFKFYMFLIIYGALIVISAIFGIIFAVSVFKAIGIGW